MSNDSHGYASNHDNMETSVDFDIVKKPFHEQFLEFNLIVIDRFSHIKGNLILVLMLKSKNSPISHLEEIRS